MQELQVEVKGGPFNLEKEFTTAWLKELRDLGFYADKISDASIGTKKVDCYIRTPNQDYCCEIKVVEADKFPLKRIRSNQWKALRVYKKNKGESIVVVYSKKYDQYKIIPFDKISGLDKNGSVKLVFKYT